MFEIFSLGLYGNKNDRHQNVPNQETKCFQQNSQINFLHDLRMCNGSEYIQENEYFLFLFLQFKLLTIIFCFLVVTMFRKKFDIFPFLIYLINCEIHFRF